MKTLVVYYSLGGKTGEISESIADGLDADLLELRTDRRIDSGNFMKYSWDQEGDAKFKLLPLDRNPDDYDLIIIGSPVWAWAPVPPIYAFMDHYPFKGKNVVLFTTSEGDPGNCQAKFSDLFGENEIGAYADFVIPPDSDLSKLKRKANHWAKDVVGSIK